MGCTFPSWLYKGCFIVEIGTKFESKGPSQSLNPLLHFNEKYLEYDELSKNWT